MTQGKPPVNLLDELGFVLEERAGVWVVQEDAGGCYPASLTERVLWKALLEMHQQRQCLHKISEPANASVPPGFALVPVRPTRAMDDVLNEEGWQWDDLLAAAEAIEEQHPDDAAVDTLAALMKAKLAKQRARGYGGWDTPECTQQRLSDMLRGHVDKGDPVDVANFCAFLAARGEGIAQAAPAAVAVPSSEDLMTLSKACQAMPGGLGMHYWNYAQAVLSRWGAAPQPPAQAQEPVAYRVLRKRLDGEWVTDGRGWCDGVPSKELVDDIALRRDGWRLEFAYRGAAPQPAPQQPAPTSEQAGAPSEPKCTACGAQLRMVTQGSDSYLSADQFDADKLGDWFCECCPKGPNKGSRKHRYFSNHELATNPTTCVTEPAAQGVLDATRGMAAEYERWIGFFHRGDGDYNDFLRIELNHDASTQAQQGGA